MASLYRHLLLEGKLISNDLGTLIRVLHSLFKVFFLYHLLWLFLPCLVSFDEPLQFSRLIPPLQDKSVYIKIRP